MNRISQIPLAEDALPQVSAAVEFASAQYPAIK